MAQTQKVGYRLCVRCFVKTGVLKADAKCAKRGVVFASERRDQARVDPTAEECGHLDVTHHLSVDGLCEQVLELLSRMVNPARRRSGVAIKLGWFGRDCWVTGAPGQKMSRL